MVRYLFLYQEEKEIMIIEYLNELLEIQGK